MLGSLSANKNHDTPNDLYKYIANSERSQEQRSQTLYSKFSTIEQISKSLEIQKQKFDNEIKEIYQRLNSNSHVINKARQLNQQIRQKISNITFSIENGSEDQSFLDLPCIAFQQICYKIKQNPKFENNIKKQQIGILTSEIQALQNQCAKLYLSETEVRLKQQKNFHTFSDQIFEQLSKIEGKCMKRIDISKEKASNLRVTKQQEILKNRIKTLQTSLTQRFQDKIMKFIQKYQSLQ